MRISDKFGSGSHGRTTVNMFDLHLYSLIVRCWWHDAVVIRTAGWSFLG